MKTILDTQTFEMDAIQEGEEPDHIGMFIQEDKEYITEELELLKERYEARYNTIVTDVALAGTVGTFQGNFTGGKVISDEIGNMFQTMPSCDHFLVNVLDDGTIEIVGIHHDSRHYMNLHFFSDPKKERCGLSHCGNHWEASDFEYIVNELNPIKADRKFKEAFGIMKEKITN